MTFYTGNSDHINQTTIKSQLGQYVSKGRYITGVSKSLKRVTTYKMVSNSTNSAKFADLTGDQYWTWDPEEQGYRRKDGKGPRAGWLYLSTWSEPVPTKRECLNCGIARPFAEFTIARDIESTCDTCTRQIATGKRKIDRDLYVSGEMSTEEFNKAEALRRGELHAPKPIVVPQVTDPKTKYLLPSFVGKPLVYSNPKPAPQSWGAKHGKLYSNGSSDFSHLPDPEYKSTEFPEGTPAIEPEPHPDAIDGAADIERQYERRLEDQGEPDTDSHLYFEACPEPQPEPEPKFYCEKCEKETDPDLLVSIPAPDLEPEYNARDYCPKCAADPEPETVRDPITGKDLEILPENTDITDPSLWTEIEGRIYSDGSGSKSEPQPEPPKFEVTSANREAWLQRAFEGTLRQWFLDQGYELPSEVRMSCGFTSDGGRKNASIGQCFLGKDGIFQIYITARIDDPSRVLDILIHELAHVAMGPEFVQIGHKKLFKQCALALGLTGKMTATTASEELVERLKPLIEELGEYPHCKLEGATGGKKKQTTRLIKVQCPSCIVDSPRGPKPYSGRFSQGIIDLGCPSCGICGQTMVPEPPKETNEACYNMEASDEDPAAIQKRKQSRKFFHLTEWFLRENSLPAKGTDSLYKDLYSVRPMPISGRADSYIDGDLCDLDVWTGSRWSKSIEGVECDLLHLNKIYLAPCFYDEVHSDLTPPKPDRDQCKHCGSTHLPYPNQKTLCRMEGTTEHKLRGSKPEDIGFCLNCLQGDSAYLKHLENMFALLYTLNNCDQTWNRSEDDSQRSDHLYGEKVNGAFGYLYNAIEKLAGSVILSAWCEWNQFIPELANRGLHYNEEYRAGVKHWKEIYLD